MEESGAEMGPELEDEHVYGMMGMVARGQVLVGSGGRESQLNLLMLRD